MPNKLTLKRILVLVQVNLISVELSQMFPDKLMVGMEIRVKVSDYVKDRITALRANHPEQYQNIACIRTNAMKYLPNFFTKGQVRNINLKHSCIRHYAPKIFGMLVLTGLNSWIFEIKSNARNADFLFS